MKNSLHEIMDDATWQKFCALSPEKQKLAIKLIRAIIDAFAEPVSEASDDIDAIREREIDGLSEIDEIKENI